MRSTTTAVLERNARIRDELATEPYELPWAGEARIFVQVLEISGALEMVTQISPDGLHWCDLDDERHRATAPGLVSWLVTGFGQWLRVRCTMTGTGADADAVVRVYLVGKS